MSKKFKFGLLILLVIAILGGIGKLFYDQRVVGVIEGNQLYYQGTVYEEFYGSLEDSSLGKTLGNVVFEGESTKCRLYTIKNHPEYLHVSFGWDHRIYGKCLITTRG